jgi:hypothetical protein
LGQNAIAIKVSPGEDVAAATARVMIGPHAASADAIRRFSFNTLGELSLSGMMTAMGEATARVSAGNMEDVEATLVSQAMALNALFADLTRRAAANIGSGPTFEAGEALMRMALRAQSQCRATLETLATIKNPPVVFAKQANIANGPQQVNNTLTAPSHAGRNSTAPNELLEAAHEQPLDTGTQGATGPSHSQMEALGTLHGTEKCRR